MQEQRWVHNKEPEQWDHRVRQKPARLQYPHSFKPKYSQEYSDQWVGDSVVQAYQCMVGQHYCVFVLLDWLPNLFDDMFHGWILKRQQAIHSPHSKMFASKPQFLPRFSLRPQLMADAELCLVKNAPSVRLSGKQVFLDEIYYKTCFSSMSLLTSKVAQF